MEKEARHRLPKAARYPLFMIGLLVLLLGELSAYSVDAGLDVMAGLAVVACVFMVLSVALR